ncbi:hypothetical protein FORMB_25490 [Formosa sp. Hel1_33_131]|uniref:hypothetical protein n=1 Tax=Formosa sp. Hel1_33_131 TaxID=1336794 RepID=UPI00084E283A|nr:hypothetical protein [Formosa sp. Hel1_33_131]AOR29566.1 hypothetical protein FORMB_25490 [Formosa sp. Hel1_33_131]
MTNHYKIHIKSCSTNLKVTYRNNTFLKVEKLTGKLTDAQVKSIGALIPPTEKAIEQHTQNLGHLIIISPIIKVKSLYTEFLDEWFAFYDDFMKIKPRFNATDGRSLKAIIKYLTEISQDEKEALQLWKIILQNWHKLDNFYKKSADLKFISSQINKILINVKGVNKTNQQVFKSAMESETGRNFKFK